MKGVLVGASLLVRNQNFLKFYLRYLSIARISVRFEEESYPFCDSLLGLGWDLPEVKGLWQPRRACLVCSEEDTVQSLKSGKRRGQNLDDKHWTLLSAALSFPFRCWNSPSFFTEPSGCHFGLWHMAVTMCLPLSRSFWRPWCCWADQWDCPVMIILFIFHPCCCLPW